MTPWNQPFVDPEGIKLHQPGEWCLINETPKPRCQRPQRAITPASSNWDHPSDYHERPSELTHDIMPSEINAMCQWSFLTIGIEGALSSGQTVDTHLLSRPLLKTVKAFLVSSFQKSQLPSFCKYVQSRKLSPSICWCISILGIPRPPLDK